MTSDLFRIEPNAVPGSIATRGVDLVKSLRSDDAVGMKPAVAERKNVATKVGGINILDRALDRLGVQVMDQARQACDSGKVVVAREIKRQLGREHRRKRCVLDQQR